ncbi:MAG: hypothetical protein IPN94_19465 [Sphingobacteriales bacterium]|nr:hypothetical protein [Sphingobacteriales bacterium]
MIALCRAVVTNCAAGVVCCGIKTAIITQNLFIVWADENEAFENNKCMAANSANLAVKMLIITSKLPIVYREINNGYTSNKCIVDVCTHLHIKTAIRI